ncbi:MAG: ComF family protein [Desulfobacterales bacterium]
MHLNRVLKYAAHDWVRPFFNIILDTVFPAKCLVCSRLFEPAVIRPGMGRSTNAATEITDTFAESHRLLAAYCCPDCVSSFMAISSPICSCCGIMFKSRQGQNHLCGDCITQPKEFRIARAAVAYDHQLMAVLHRFKYAGKIQLAGPLGGLMLNAYMRYWDREKADLILPVPLHTIKFRKRGFNQSYLLIRRWKSISAPMVGEVAGLPVNTNVLIRSKATVSQTGLGRQQRLKNIKGAFRVKIPEKVIAKKVLLIDDVYTTGATVNECARVLLKAGAERVDVLTVARAM